MLDRHGKEAVFPEAMGRSLIRGLELAFFKISLETRSHVPDLQRRPGRDFYLDGKSFRWIATSEPGRVRNGRR